MSAFLLPPPPRSISTLLPVVAAATFLLNVPHLSVAAQPPPATLSAPSQVSPSTHSRISDPARIFTTGQATRLSSRLEKLESDTGIRILVATPRGAGARDYRWPTPERRTVVIAANGNAGNVLSFSVGDGVAMMGLPMSFWVEAGNRFGNVFFVRERGIDGAVDAVVDAVEGCVRGGRMCRYVPGLSEDQWKVSAVSAALGGCIAGAASRTGGKKLNFPFVVLFAPLWGIFLVSFGVGPVVQRVPGVGIEVLSVMGAFLACAGAVWLWVPSRFGKPGEEEG